MARRYTSWRSSGSDPEPDQGQPEEDLVDNGQENNPDENILPLTELEKQMVNRVLLELEKLKNVNVQNYQIQKITFCHVPAKTMNGILLLCEMFFNQLSYRILIGWL